MTIRKTIKVADVVARANRMLEVTPDEWVGERHGIAALLEWILMETGQYAGFKYQRSQFLPAEEQTLDDVLARVKLYDWIREVPGYDGGRRHYHFREA